MNQPNELAFQRIEKVLTFIETNLDQPLCLDKLANASQWSRWQLQRVFTHLTGLSLAQYVRELRLSRAAELLLTSDQRHLDIALACGFNSEISFSRAFRQQFDCTPGQYRKRNVYSGIRTPITKFSHQPDQQKTLDLFIQIRVETSTDFNNTSLSDTPNKQTYAVIPHYGPSKEIRKTVQWAINHWLPICGYDPIDSQTRHVQFGMSTPTNQDKDIVECWLPVRHSTKRFAT